MNLRIDDCVFYGPLNSVSFIWGCLENCFMKVSIKYELRRLGAILHPRNLILWNFVAMKINTCIPTDLFKRSEFPRRGAVIELLEAPSYGAEIRGVRIAFGQPATGKLLVMMRFFF